MGKIAIFFPGIGYHNDKPLLYYSRKIAKEAGYELLNVEYHDISVEVKGNPSELARAAVEAYNQTVSFLKDTDFPQYDQVLFVGKSIGTIIASRYARDFGIKAEMIWYTPLEATYDFPSVNTISFIGTKDPFSDVQRIRNLSAETGIKLHVYEGANHSLETENTLQNLEYITDVMIKTKDFIERKSNV